MSSPVLGIDLGTTNTVVAVCGREGVEVLRDREGESLTPSIVSFLPSAEIAVGRPARERRLIDAANTVFSVKRLIGRPFRTPEVRRTAERSPFTIAESSNGGVEVRVRGQRYSLPEISAFVLRRARALAEEALGKTSAHVVLTVPASFNELQRTATRDAGRIAGLHVLRILNEPTAAALAYGFGARTDKRVAIYDLGGGTFDLSILDLSGDVIEVIATAGDSYLGGDDVDTLIADRMAASFLAQHRVDLSADPQTYERLRVAAEWLKVQLSGTDRAHVRVEQAAFAPGGKPLDLAFSMTRAEHDQLLTPLVQRTFDICENAMRVASLRPSQIDEVILVGGQTMAPRVRDMVAQYFGRPALTTVNPSHVVAEGAAVLGYALTGGKPAAAPAPTRARPEGATFTTLVPPAPSVPPSASVSPSPLPPPSGPPVGVPVSPTFSSTPASPLSRSSAPRAPATLSSAPAPLLREPDATLPEPVPAPRLPVFPGFDDEADEPTRIAARIAPGPTPFTSSDEEPTQHVVPRSTPPAAQAPFTSSDEEPTEHMVPRPAVPFTSSDEEPTRHATPRSEPPTAAARSLEMELDQEPSPAVIAPASAARVSPVPGLPLAAVGLRKRPSVPPPAAPVAPPRPATSSRPPAGAEARPSPPAPRASRPVPPARRTVPPRPLTAPPPAGPSPVPRPSSRPAPPVPTPVAAPLAAPVPAAVSPLPTAAAVAAPAGHPSSVPARPAAMSDTLPLGSAAPSARPPVQELERPITVPPPSWDEPEPPPAQRPAPPPAPPAASQRPTSQRPASEPSEPVSEPARAPLLLDVTPLTLAIETAGGYCEPIIERNAPIPTEQTRRFSTSQDNQSSVRMRICQGEDRRVEQNQFLGTIELSDLRPAARGAVKIEVTFMLDADGRLQVRARDNDTGKSQRVALDLVGGLRDDDVARMQKRQRSLTLRE